MTEQLLTIQEAAQRLNLRPKTLRRWIALRKIEFIKAGERAVRISSAEIDRVIDTGRVPRRFLGPSLEKRTATIIERDGAR